MRTETQETAVAMKKRREGLTVAKSENGTASRIQIQDWTPRRREGKTGGQQARKAQVEVLQTETYS